jgi:Lipocalin-like domain
LALKAEDLFGTWRLRSWKNAGSDGSEVYPLGEPPVGYIFYNDDGYMSVEIMAADRVPYQEADAFGGTPQERSEAISTYLSYAGPFEVLPDRDTVSTISRSVRIRTGSATLRCVSPNLRGACWC